MISLRGYAVLVDTLARTSLKSEAGRLYLSYFWWVLEPALYVAVFYFVFQYLLTRGQESFVFFLVCGKIPFLWFSKATVTSAESILQNKGLISALRVPKILFPYVAVQITLYKQWFAFALLALVAFYFDSWVTINWLWLIPLTCALYVFILATAITAALVVTVVQDFRIVISMAMLFLMFSSGVFWDINAIEDPALRTLLLNFNPLVYLLDGYRQVLMFDQAPDLSMMIRLFLFSAAWVFLGHYFYSRVDNFLSQHLMQA